MAVISTEGLSPAQLAEFVHRQRVENAVRVGLFAVLCAASAAVGIFAGNLVVHATSGQNGEQPVCTYRVPHRWGLSDFASLTDATVQQLGEMNGINPGTDRLQEDADFKAPCSPELEPYLAR